MKFTKKMVITLAAVVVVIALAITGIIVTVNSKKKEEAYQKELNEVTKVIESAGDVVPFFSEEENDDSSESLVDTKNNDKNPGENIGDNNSTNKSGEQNNGNNKNDQENTSGQNNPEEPQTTENPGSNGGNGEMPEVTSAPGKTYYNYTYEDMIKNGNSLVQKYGNSIKKEVIGTTLFGRDIVSFRVGNDGASRKMLVVAGVNGSEHDNALVLMKQIETYLADTTGTFRGKKYAEILDKCQIYFVPMLNPDGIEISINGLASVPSQYRSTVEQIAKYSADNGLMSAGDYSMWNANGQGIDVSINFGTGTVISKTLSEQPSSKNYPGTEFASNEAQAIKNLCKKVSFETATVYAGTGNLIDWSFGQVTSAQVSSDLAAGLAANTGFTVISNGPTYDFCISVNLAQWFIFEFDRPAFSVLMGGITPYSKNDVQSIWKAVSTAPLFLADDGNGFTDYETIE